MAYLSGKEAAQVLNTMDRDGNIYCLREEGTDNPIPELIYVAVKVFVGERPAYYRIAETLTVEAAMERISEVLKE